MHFSIDRTVHTTAFDKPVVDHWLERKIAQTATGSTEKDRWCSEVIFLERRKLEKIKYIDAGGSKSRRALSKDQRYILFGLKDVLLEWLISFMDQLCL